MKVSYMTKRENQLEERLRYVSLSSFLESYKRAAHRCMHIILSRAREAKRSP